MQKIKSDIGQCGLISRRRMIFCVSAETKVLSLEAGDFKATIQTKKSSPYLTLKIIHPRNSVDRTCKKLQENHEEGFQVARRCLRTASKQNALRL